MKAAKQKLILALFGALVLVYLAFQIYYVASPSYRTEVAVLYSVTDAIPASGTVVREESVSPEQSGVSYFLVSDGDKVAKGATVAERYAGADIAAANLRLAELRRELVIVQSLADSGRGSVNLASLKRGIRNTLAESAGALAARDYSGVAETRLSLLSMLGSYELSSGGEIDASARAAELQSEIAALEGQALAPTGYVTTDSSGYFVSFTDGCEGILTEAELATLDADAIAERIDAAHAAYALDEEHFKILSAYSWRYVCVLSAADAARLRVGRSYTLSFRYSAVGELPAEVESLIPNASGERVAAVFRCDRLNSDIARLRNEDVLIRFSNYEGIRVERSALRMVDGELGVYIKYGGVVKFRKLDPIYETEDYILSSVTEGSSEYLSLYDEIITSGKDLVVDKQLSSRG